MAIHFVTGRPGGGKGLYCMKLLEDEIRGTDRQIVTNFPLLTSELGSVLQDKYGDTFDILNRVHLIEEDAELRNFYRIRGQHHEKEENWLEVETDKKGKAIAYDISGAFEKGGVFYLLDEVHLVFGARDWQDMGRAVIYYASQHRKLGDDVILITQAPKNVDNQFRSLAQDYTVLRNHGMEKISWFKQPDIFSRKTYLNLPNPGTKDQPLESSHFRLDLDWANCYETDRGVGIEKGKGGDKGKDRRKGVRWYWGLIGLAAGLLLIWVFITKGLGYFTDKIIPSIPISKDSNATVAENNQTTEERVKALLSKRREKMGPAVDDDGLPVKQEPEKLEVLVQTNVITGFLVQRFRGKSQASFSLSDGRVYRTGTGVISQLDGNGILDKYGRFFRWGPGIFFDPRELLD